MNTFSVHEGSKLNLEVTSTETSSSVREKWFGLIFTIPLNIVTLPNLLRGLVFTLGDPKKQNSGIYTFSFLKFF